MLSCYFRLKNRKKSRFFSKIHHYLYHVCTSFEKKHVSLCYNKDTINGTQKNQSSESCTCRERNDQQATGRNLRQRPCFISKWVTNVAQPNVEMFIQLAKILEVSIDDLLWTEE